MGIIKGGALRLVSTTLYFVTFGAAAIMVGAMAWFIVTFKGSKTDFAVVGISAVSLAYSALATVLTCCLAGISFFSLLGAIVDFLLFGAMIAVAVLYRSARFGCPPRATNPNSCRLFVGTWVLSIISLAAYLINGVVSIIIRRRKDKTVPKGKDFR